MLGQEHWNVVPFVRAESNDVAARFGTRWNSYDGHGLAPARGSAFTVDHWWKNGRGHPVPEAAGDALVAWVLGQHQITPVRILIWYSWWWRPGVGWKPYPGLHGNHGPGEDSHIHIGY